MKCLLELCFIEIVFFQGIRISTERELPGMHVRIHV